MPSGQTITYITSWNNLIGKKLAGQQKYKYKILEIASRSGLCSQLISKEQSKCKHLQIKYTYPHNVQLNTYKV